MGTVKGEACSPHQTLSLGREKEAEGEKRIVSERRNRREGPPCTHAVKKRF